MGYMQYTFYSYYLSFDILISILKNNFSNIDFFGAKIYNKSQLRTVEAIISIILDWEYHNKKSESQ